MSLFPGLDDAFLEVVDPHTAGDPDQDTVLWTNLSRPNIAEALLRLGFRVSVTVVSQLLRRHRLGYRKARKTLPLGRHADRDKQFHIIAKHRAEFAASPDPIVSMDTKAKEFLGLLFRKGRLYTQEAKRALDHDFPSAAWGVIYPHGFYDVKRNVGHLNLGLSHDTSRFACDSLAQWWEQQGRPAYPQARRLLLLCDGGGSNASNRYVFKYHLERLAVRVGLSIRVAHYPAYCSTVSGTGGAWLGSAWKPLKVSGIPGSGKALAKHLQPMPADPPEGSQLFAQAMIPPTVSAWR